MGTSGQDLDKSSGRRRGTPVLWSIAIALGAVALVCATYGWWIHDGRPPLPRSFQGVLDWLDIPVRGVQALLLSDIYFDDGLSPEAQWWLQVARISGAMFSLVVAGRLLFKALGDSILQRSLRGRRGHVVIFGDGPAASDFVAVNGFGQVTQIAHGLEFSPGRFAHLPGEGTLADQAVNSAAGRARCILVNEEDDERTWQTAMALSRHVHGRDIVAVMGGLEHNTSESRLRSISYSTGVARQVLLAHPPYLLAAAMGAATQHILIVGFGAIGQAILREFFVTCPVLDPAGMRITVVTSDAEKRAAGFLAAHPGLGSIVDMEFIEGDLRETDSALLERVRERQRGGEICAVYLTLGEFDSIVGDADRLRTTAIKHDLFRAPIFFYSDDGAALADVRHGAGLLGPQIEGDDERGRMASRAAVENRICELSVLPFGAWRDALDGTGLMAPKLDAEARKIHETYLASSGTEVGSNTVSPASRPWEALDGEYRVSNRRAAAHIRAKAYSAGYDLNAWLDEAPGGRMSHELPPAAGKFQASDPDFVLRMAKLEHRRWMFERLLNGWVAGETRNNFRKVHNMLKPFEELAPAEQNKDAAVVEVTRKLLGG